MKVVHVLTMINGGAGIAASRIHQGLLREGVESSIVQRDQSTDFSKNIIQCTVYHDLYYRIVNKTGLKSLLTPEGKFKDKISKFPRNYETVTLPYSYFPIEELPVIKDADIIHLHWVGNFLNYPTFFAKIKQPVVWTLHDMNPFMGIFHYEGDQANNKNLETVDKKIIKAKAKFVHQKDNIYIVTPSEWMKKKSESSTILGKYPHFLVPYGFDQKNYPVLDKNKSKELLKLNNGRINILFVAFGLNVHRKGLDLLIEAVNQLDPSTFNLISVGGGEDLPLDKRINYIRIGRTNDISELNRIYTVADVTIIPSREDNSPNVMTESLLNGTPVISFSNGGMREYIETGRNGILQNEINSESLKNGIQNFINKKYTFDENSIRYDIMRKMPFEKQTNTYINLYKKILGQ